MPTIPQEIKAALVLTCAVTGSHGSVYLKIPKDVNAGSVGLQKGDNVQIGIIQITHKAKPRKEVED